MKTFEEKYTQWIDGTLTGSEREAFEAELGDRKAAAEREKADMAKLGNLLRTQLKSPALSNAEFFNHQILQQIEAEQPKAKRPAEKVRFEWSLARLLWASASCMLVATGLFVTFVAPAPHTGPAQIDYYAQILHTQTEDPAISAVAFHSNKDNVTVLWLDGLEYVPRETPAPGHK